MIRFNIFLAGAQKAGTTSLYDWIGSHPEVHAPRSIKDFAHFSDSAVAVDEALYGKLLAGGAGRPAVMACETNALYVPEAASRIHTYNPACRILIVLRDPVQRAFSAWRYAVERGLEERTFDRAIEEELAGKGYPSVFRANQMDYLGHGRYAAPVNRFLDLFGPDRVWIGLFEDLVSDASVFLRDLFGFLGVDPDVGVRAVRSNATAGGARSARLNRFLHDGDRREGSSIAALFEMLPVRFRFALRRAIYLRLSEWNKKRVPVEPVDPALRLRLTEHFAGEVEDLGERLGRDLQAIWFPTTA